ncbi:MAG: DUF3786 domain-containing protein [Planctomycetota bacterium]
MAHEGLWEQLDKLDGTETARRAKCRYLTNPQRYIVPLLNKEFVVNLSDRSILSAPPDSPQHPADFLEQLCLLAYLINARDLPLAGKLCNADALPGGQFFFRGPHSLPTKKLQSTFGDRPDLLHQVSRHLDAEQCEFGDASVRLYILPRVPLTIIIWGRCEEFDSRASILFDKNTADQMPLDALLAAVNLAVQVMTRAAQDY